MMEKQGVFDEASHSSDAVRKRASLAAHVHPCRQSPCPNFHPRPCVAQSGRRLDRPANLRRLQHQPHHLHSRAAVVPRISGLEAVLHDKRQQRYRQALTGGQAAHLIAIACSPVPTGHDHWTVRLLAGKAVELGFVESISPETIRQLLKKMNSSPGNTKSGASRL